MTHGADSGVTVHRVAAMCTMTEPALWVAPARLFCDASDSLGCDSSDCLLCHFSHSPCEQHTHARTHHLGGNRSSAGSMRARKRERRTQSPAPNIRSAGPVCSTGSLETEPSWGQSSERQSSLDTEATGEQEQGTCRDSHDTSPPSQTSLPRPWQWQPAWAALQHPPQAHMQPLAQLLSTGQQQQQQQRSSSVVSSLGFSPAGTMLAAGSVNKEVTLYSVPDMEATSFLPAPLDLAGVYNTPGKVSCLAWDPCHDGLVTIGDYDGVMYQVHLNTGHHVTELEAHSGRRIWSVAHSPLQPRLCMSSSDDGTARLWAGRGLASQALVIRPPAASAWGRAASVCCAEFSPEDEHLVALASADHAVYLYDIRAAVEPLAVLQHHSRPVSYVRFLGPRSLVSSSTDGSLAVWELGGAGSWGGGELGAAPQKVMRGHRNAKNFVGLSVLPEAGLIACGSESGAVYAYHTAWDTPLASCSTAAAGGMSCRPSAPRPPLGDAAWGADAGHGFVSSVCWLPAAAAGGGAVLAAGTWCGEVTLMALADGDAEPEP